MTDLDQLRQEVLEANLALPAHGLVKLTWGNASGVDRDRGADGDQGQRRGLRAHDRRRRGAHRSRERRGGTDPARPDRKPSTDTPTHRALYNAFDGIGGIVHTHSTWATAWAQAEQEIPLLGTTHADLMAEAVPLTRQLTAEEVRARLRGRDRHDPHRADRRPRRRAPRRARARARAVLLGRQSRRRGHHRGDAGGGGPAGAADADAQPATAGRWPTCCATSTTSASTGPTRTTASAERGAPGDHQRSCTCSRMRRS